MSGELDPQTLLESQPSRRLGFPKPLIPVAAALLLTACTTGPRPHLEDAPVETGRISTDNSGNHADRSDEFIDLTGETYQNYLTSNERVEFIKQQMVESTKDLLAVVQENPNLYFFIHREDNSGNQSSGIRVEGKNEKGETVLFNVFGHLVPDGAPNSVQVTDAFGGPAFVMEPYALSVYVMPEDRNSDTNEADAAFSMMFDTGTYVSVYADTSDTDKHYYRVMPDGTSQYTESLIDDGGSGSGPAPDETEARRIDARTAQRALELISLAGDYRQASYSDSEEYEAEETGSPEFDGNSNAENVNGGSSSNNTNTGATVSEVLSPSTTIAVGSIPQTR